MLQNLDREPREDVLGGPGDNYDVYKYSWPMTVVRRQPLVYSPRSTARHNYGLLPDIPAMAEMELAYRAQAFSMKDIAAFARGGGGFWFIAGVAAPLIAVLIGRRLPIEHVAWLAPALTTLAVVQLVITRTATAKRFLWVFLTPITVLVFLKMIAAVFEYRVLAAAIAAVGSFLLIRRFGRRPFEFYLEWVYTHPRLKPETRSELPTSPKPDLLLLAVIFLIAVLGPLLSIAGSMIAIALLSLVRIAASSARDQAAHRASADGDTVPAGEQTVQNAPGAPPPPDTSSPNPAEAGNARRAVLITLRKGF
ncbi:MAG: hypothetical protein WC718_02070, partial [Phycisphaerales bacterium]